MDSLNEQRHETSDTAYTPPPAGRQEIPPGLEVSRRRGLPYKSTILAGVMSMVPGLGQIYTGAYQQGFINIMVVSGVITLLASGNAHGMEPLLGIFLAFFWFYSQIDAIRRVQYYNRALEGAGSIAEMEDIKLAGAGGGTFTGVVMVVFGVLALSNTMFDVSLAWLADWWPLGLVAAGVWLIMRARREKA
jgi:hypothetical protein